MQGIKTDTGNFKIVNTYSYRAQLKKMGEVYDFCRKY